jgi:uncharacterized protein (TIRG00374 family)
MDSALKLPLRYERRFTLGLILMVMLGVVVVIVDWEEIRNIMIAADWKVLPVAILFTLISYACISYSFALVNGLLGVRVNRHTLAEIGFVSTVINHVLTSGGAAGYSIRYILMKRYRVNSQDILAVSILHFYLTSLVMLGMLPVGLLYLFTNSTVSGGLETFMLVMASIIIVVFIFGSGLIFSQSMRRNVLSPLGRVVGRIFGRDIMEILNNFDVTMYRGVKAWRKHPSVILLIMALVVIDWITSAGVLWLSFVALGDPVEVGVLMTGFVIGIMAGVLSMIPGGMGVQEGSMAGIFALLGVSFDQALLASILFRVVYFFFPYALSIAFHYRFMQKDLV